MAALAKQQSDISRVLGLEREAWAREMKGKWQVKKMVDAKRDIAVIGSGDVDSLLMEVMYEDREMGGTKKFKLLKMHDFVAKSTNSDVFVTALKKRLEMLVQLGSVVLFVADLDVLPILAKKPELVFRNEVSYVVRRKMEDMIDRFVETVQSSSVTCVAYCTMERFKYVSENRKLASLFTQMIPSE